MVKCMRLLGNLFWGINPIQKQLLYRCYVLPIVLYEFQLWFYNKAPLLYLVKILRKMQRRAAIWILKAFKTLPMDGLETITGLIPIKFHVQKLASRSQLWYAALPKNHLIKSLIDDPHNLLIKHSSHSINLFTNCQKSNIKDYLIDSNNKLFGVFPSFFPLNPEFILGSRVVDIFPDQFSFNLAKGINNNSCIQQVDEMTLRSLSSPNTAIVITDASVKNDIATSISHIHSFNQLLIKTVHYATFVTSIEAELFAIRCGINQACSTENISKIIIVTDFIHVARKIFDDKSNPYQIHSTAVLWELQHFFPAGQENSIEFWKCPSCFRWRLHKLVNKESKSFNPIPSLTSKISWDFCKKTDSNNIINLWKMTFQALDGKEKNFLDLVDINNNTIKLSHIKGGLWLQAFGSSNSICACTTRAITNHTPIREYHLRFFLKKDFKYSCGLYPIETRRHILYECIRYNGYWNPKRDLLYYFVMFLSANPLAFTFIWQFSSSQSKLILEW